jgi:hypothetical protein
LSSPSLFWYEPVDGRDWEEEHVPDEAAESEDEDETDDDEEEDTEEEEDPS